MSWLREGVERQLAPIVTHNADSPKFLLSNDRDLICDSKVFFVH